MPRFAANISMLFTEAAFEHRVRLARQAGFEGVECWFPYDLRPSQITALLEEQGIAMVLINAPAGDWQSGERGLLALPGREHDFRNGFEVALEYAAQIGCKQINCLAGVPDASVTDYDALACAIDNLGYAAERAALFGIDCLIEPINAQDVPGFAINTSAQALALMDKVALPNIKLQYDLYHMQIMEGNLARRLEKLLPRIAHIQFADNPGRHEPGTGELNFAFLFDWLDRIGYDGWISAEYLPSHRTETSLGWMTTRG